jgi:HK97 gp10 family phage protein
MASNGVAFYLQMKNDKRLERTLLSLPKKIARKVISPASKTTAKIAQAAIKQDTPVLTGELRRSLAVRAIKKSRRYVGFNVRFSRRKNADGFHAPFIELGTKHIEARHFQEKAFNRARRRMKTRFRREFYRNLAKVVPERKK